MKQVSIPGPAAMPPKLIARIGELLHNHQADALFAPMLAMLVSHVAPQPRRPEVLGESVIDAGLMRTLVRMLARYHASNLLVALVDEITPYMPVMPPKPAEVVDIIVRGRHTHAGEALSTREREVLGFMAEGTPNIAIARALYLSEDTVKTHASRLFRKLGARDRAHAVAIAYRTGHLAISTDQPAAS